MPQQIVVADHLHIKRLTAIKGMFGQHALAKSMDGINCCFIHAGEREF